MKSISLKLSLGNKTKVRLNSIWNNIIEENPKNDHQAYVLVGAILIEYQLYDAALDVYQKGRKKFWDKLLFTFEICHIYTIAVGIQIAFI